MPLDDREQRILEEIERHLYEEDPRLAHTVAKASFGNRERLRRRLAIVGFIVGVLVMLGSFTSSSLIAGIGFVLMVVSGGVIVMGLRGHRVEHGAGLGMHGWLDSLRERWRRDR